MTDKVIKFSIKVSFKLNFNFSTKNLGHFATIISAKYNICIVK